MLVSLNEASRLTGKSKSVISNALKNGVLSYVSRDVTGYRIDTSELFRVYSRRTPKRTVERRSSERELPVQNPFEKDHENEILRLKLEMLEKENDRLREQNQKDELKANRQIQRLENDIEQLIQDKDQWQRQATHLLPAPPQHLREANFRRTLIDRVSSK